MTVWPATAVSNGGISRSEPSRNPTYQSGCEPVETMSGRYGPYVQIGLISATAASTTRTPKTMRNRPVEFVMNCGNSGLPTALRLVRPRPAHWVCFR
ncbi:topoisomerase C-terminal repeat-containing protein [Streptomyces anthocyanicus]|uniref:topoisomerase C-terminal repeat-containing protein n=1 Tax=Streptomyces anthocyanicus TaxID=68174 RepID=UPI0036512D53